MSKELLESQGPTLGLSSSAEMFEKLRFESKRLQKDWHHYDAFNFLVTAWHLFQDWPASDEKKALSRTKRQRKNLPKEMNLLLDVIRDLVNGSKHFKLNPRAVKKKRVELVHLGEECDFYSFFFHEEILGVTVDQYWYFSIRVLNNLILRFFEWVFDDKVLVKDFPEDLRISILYCNIAERCEPAPELWLKNS